jgi:hypothetical protein
MTRHGETELCSRWKASLAMLAPNLRVRRNYPYAGKNDGLTAYLRGRFAADEYIGVELEVNQAIVMAGGRSWAVLRALLIESLHAVIENIA